MRNFRANQALKQHTRLKLSMGKTSSFLPLEIEKGGLEIASVSNP